MFDLSASARRIYRRLLHRSAEGDLADSGAVIEADGLAAVAAVETAIADPAVTGATGRDRLAAALGFAAAGRRASAVLSGPELAASLDLLTMGARQRLPLVVHLVASRGPTPDTAAGSHEAYHAAAATGAVLLFAANVQEAVDLTLLARRLAEDALCPVVVAMDGVETAFAVQDLRLPSPSAMERFVGRSADVVHPGTASQEMLFGRHRRRVPRWHDPQRPVLHGALLGPEAFALAGAARRVFFDAPVPELLAKASEALEHEIGRRPETLRTYHTERARVLLVAQGAAVETAEAVAAYCKSRKLAVGVVGLRTLRPLPTDALTELLRGRRNVAVLERVDAPLLAEPPLLGEIRSLLAGGAMPALTSVLYGLGGYPLRAADLAGFVRELATGDGDPRSPVYLGLDVHAATGAYPKRQALRDALGREYPEIAGLGIRGEAGSADMLPEGALTLTIHRLAGQDDSGGGWDRGREAAGLLHRLLGGQVRSRLTGGRQPWGAACVETITLAASDLKDPGDGVASDLAVWLGGAGGLARLKRDGCVLLADASRPAGLRRAVAERGLRVYAADGTEDRLLGALAGVLGLEGHAVSLRKLLAARREMLEERGASGMESRLDKLQSGFESVRQIEVGGLEEDAQVDADAGPPPVVRRLGRSEVPLADLPAFWDRTGVLYRDGETAGLWPEPFLATGTMPPCSAALRDLSPARTVLPAFDPELCTGCGACWTACPDSAIGPVPIAPSALLEHGMKLARAGGGSVDKLNMVARKLTSGVAKEAAADWRGGPAGPLFDAAFEATLAAMKLGLERQGEVREAYAAVREVIGELPIARTTPFVDQLLAIAIDPDACKGCELCVAACEPGALTAGADDPRRMREARARWRFCDELPAPSDKTLEAARQHPDIGPLAGALLSRRAREIMTGGHGAESGSGEALALRQILGGAAYHRDPILRAQLAEIGELKAGLTTAIHETLAHALPDHDLDALADGLDALKRPDAELGELTARVESAFETDRVDVSRTRRLVAAARDLANLEWRLETGESGLGQAPLSLVLDGTALPWAGAFPHHPFKVPVTVAAGEAIAVARGLVEAGLRDAAEAVRAIRRARLELDPPARPSADLEGLTWADLSREERSICPPVFVVTTDEALFRTPPAVFESLNRAAPLKLIVLSDPLSGNSADVLRYLKALSAMVVAQSSVAHVDHLDQAINDVLAHDGPAVMRILAPSPTRGAFPPREMLAEARRQVDSEAFGLLGLDPGGRSSPVPEVETGAEQPAADEGRRADNAALQALQQQHAAELAALRRDYTSRLASQQASFRTDMAVQVRDRLMRLVESVPETQVWNVRQPGPLSNSKS